MTSVPFLWIYCSIFQLLFSESYCYLLNQMPVLSVYDDDDDDDDGGE